MQLQKEMNQNNPAIKKCAAPKKYSRSQNKVGLKRSWIYSIQVLSRDHNRVLMNTIAICSVTT